MKLTHSFQAKFAYQSCYLDIQVEFNGETVESVISVVGFDFFGTDAKTSSDLTLLFVDDGPLRKYMDMIVNDLTEKGVWAEMYNEEIEFQNQLKNK